MPVRLSVQGKGAELVRQGLQNLQREIPRVGAQQIYEAFQRAQKKVVTYPPPLPAQRYKRTGRYGRSWYIRRNPSAARSLPGYSLIGRAVGPRGKDYTALVGGNAYGQGQAQIHQGRWVRARDAVEEEVRGLPPVIQRYLDMVARREIQR